MILDLFSLLYYDTVDRKAYGKVENNRPPTLTKFMPRNVLYCARIK